MNRGYPAAIVTYLFWGLSPIYWKIISAIPAAEILGLRIWWSVPFLLLVLTIRRDFSVFNTVRKNPVKYLVYIGSAFLLGINWMVWIWSINNGYVVDASLGYFINPLLNVVMGVLLLHEHLRRMQWLALLLALMGVIYLTLNYGQFPWIALTLAGTFGLYGFIRKTAALGALTGLTIEISVLLFPALSLLVFLGQTSTLVFPTLDLDMHLWLSLSGLITVLPLTLFAYGARKIPYSTIGFIQYIAPSLQFLLGVFVFKELFNTDKLIGFSFIWLALILYSLENLYFHKVKAKR